MASPVTSDLGPSPPVHHPAQSPPQSPPNDPLLHCPPRKGHLKPLRTKAEVDSSLRLVDACVVRVHSKDANTVIKFIDAALADRVLPNMQHLRRVAKPSALAPAILEKLQHQVTPGGSPALFALAAPTSVMPASALAELINSLPLPSRERSRGSVGTGSGNSSRRRSPVSQPGSAAMSRSGSSQSAPVQSVPMSRDGSSRSGSARSDKSRAKSVAMSRSRSNSVPLQVRTIQIPLVAPASAADAKTWSEEFWPVVHRAHNAFGPQPAQWKRSGAPIESPAGGYIALAEMLARESQAMGHGLGAGAVIVSTPVDDAPGGGIIAGAGDVRWLPPFGQQTTAPDNSKDMGPCGVAGNGNPMAHAVMRAIGMVARQRVALSKGQAPVPSPVLHDGPLNKLEETLNDASKLLPGGYLCTGLDIFLTHEPCIACCMAILHSRFARVVFWKGSKAGGLSAELAKGHEVLGDKSGNVSARWGGSADGVMELTSKLKYTRVDGASVSREKNEGVGGRYGLWHRAELNWRLMAWQWIDDDGEPNVEGFHA